MNKAQLNKKAERLKEVDEVIKHLDPAIRASAFDLLRPYVVGVSNSSAGKPSPISDQTEGPPEGREDFFSRFDTEKPAENALLLAGYYYSEHGSHPFNVEELRNLARAVGLIVPERIDMTFRNARREGKALFQSISRGSFRPTVHGELFFKTTYNVSPGRNAVSHSFEPPTNGQ